MPDGTPPDKLSDTRVMLPWAATFGKSIWFDDCRDAEFGRWRLRLQSMRTAENRDFSSANLRHQTI
jgi:hypothetical protein